ncbi:uncharacterized protein MYCFIDRAFT_210239 [Pseudocercospora fijiensis CIRAD86]|uniref:Uncharacterized protein n=1 Tax=Pseudocercospora fijiensis (strain CIRAD86) TaxID=383855 RepID=M3B816_PSEFD|nr:uncharacterized protein MYCFIDRAFT_210239 [Pseudocercospora fijiensis CIRAD86]EME85463.1 hypothetical protein MYCFIDRAFT_210239 [Pseudocercospora fijiensis CIRAD86]
MLSLRLLPTQPHINRDSTDASIHTIHLSSEYSAKVATALNALHFVVMYIIFPDGTGLDDQTAATEVRFELQPRATDAGQTVRHG